MPLLKGKKNIGHNIEIEEAHGKPHDQAVAIALRTAGVPKKGKDAFSLYKDELGFGDGDVVTWRGAGPYKVLKVNPNGSVMIRLMTVIGGVRYWDGPVSAVPFENAKRDIKLGREAGKDLEPVPVGKDASSPVFELTPVPMPAGRRNEPSQAGKDAKAKDTVTVVQALQYAGFRRAGGDSELNYWRKGALYVETDRMDPEKWYWFGSGKRELKRGIGAEALYAAMGEKPPATDALFPVDDVAFPKGESPREKAGLTAQEWNALPPERRKALIAEGGKGKDAKLHVGQLVKIVGAFGAQYGVLKEVDTTSNPDSAVAIVTVTEGPDKGKLVRTRLFLVEPDARHGGKGKDSEATARERWNRGSRKYRNDVLRESGLSTIMVGRQWDAFSAEQKATLTYTIDQGDDPDAEDASPEELEIAGDRRRALDAWRVVAKDRSLPEARRAAARDAVQALAFGAADPYVHPSAGRTRRFQDRARAVDHALQRTRSGERVRVWDDENSEYVVEPMGRDAVVPVESLKAGDTFISPNGSTQTIKSIELNDHGNYSISTDRGRFVFKPGTKLSTTHFARDEHEGFGAADPYVHPSAGRTRRFQDRARAVDHALQRTRSGERVRVKDSGQEYIVEPMGRDGVGGFEVSPDGQIIRKLGSYRGWEVTQETGNFKAVKHSYGGVTVLNAETQRALERKIDRHEDAARDHACDEHEGFEKLEHSLAHEKGVKDPAAVAAAIGRKKYGAAGMAKKAAAGRGKDWGEWEEPAESLDDAVDKFLEEVDWPRSEAIALLKHAPGGRTSTWEGKLRWALGESEKIDRQKRKAKDTALLPV
jgi:hypothetical protein